MNLPILETVLTGLFDYSGMFPPAAKPFETVLSDAAIFEKKLTRPWLVGSELVADIDTVRKLSQLDLRSIGFASEVRVCLLAPSPQLPIRELSDELSKASRDDGIRRRIVSIELKLNGESAKSVLTPISAVAEELDAALVLEPDLSKADWIEQLERSTDVLVTASCRVAFKCRCTGPTAIGADRLASVIASVSKKLLPFKVTGGLHHPVVESERYGNTLGFLNVAVGFYLHRVVGNDLDLSQLKALLTNSQAELLTFDGALRYGEHSASKEQVEGVRAGAGISIGSCSLEEPDEDLVRLFGSP